MLVVTGDAAAITGDLLGRLLETHRGEGAAATVLSFEPADPGAYGRIVRDADGDAGGDRRGRRRERRRARDRARSTPRSTSSRADKLWPALERLGPENAQGELYLTDTVRDLVGGR